VKIKYGLIGFVSFLLALFIPIMIAYMIGLSDNTGILLTAIALLTATVIVCTKVILDSIKYIKMEE